MKSTGMTAVFSTLLKVFVGASAVLALGFIAFGFALQAPAKSFVPVCLVLVGCGTLVGCVFGYVGAWYRPRFLLIYLVVSSITTGLQLVLLLCIFFASGKVAATIQMESGLSVNTRDYIIHKLTIGKWIFIWVVLGEVVSIAVALGMYLTGQVEGRYDNLTADEAQNLHTVELNSIKNSMGQPTQDKGSNRLAAKLQAKYGAHSNEDFMAGRRWYNWFS